jgi:hypothetical protein
MIKSQFKKTKAFKSTEFNKPKQNRKDRNVSNQKKPSLLKESFSSVANIDFVKLTTHNFLISGLDGTRTRDPMRDRHVF